MSIESQKPLSDAEYNLLKRIRESNLAGISTIGIALMNQYENKHRQIISNNILQEEIRELIHTQEYNVIDAICELNRSGRRPVTPFYFFRQQVRAEIKKLRTLRAVYKRIS